MSADTQQVILIHSVTRVSGLGSFRSRARGWRGLHFIQATRPVGNAALLQMQTERGGTCAKFLRAPCSRVLTPYAQCVV